MILNKPNIFERLAARNQEDNFDFSTQSEPAHPATEFSNPIEENADAPSSNGNIFERLAAKNTKQKQNKFGWLDTFRDVGEQVISKGISGLGGAYGNILDTLGLQTKQNEVLPGQKNLYDIQSRILDKLNRGEVPSYGEFLLLSDDDYAPNYTRLPTSRDIQEGIKDVTGIGEGKTPSGRIAGHTAEFIGEGAATGGGAKALLGLGASAAAGQGIREAGGPEILASGTEIAGSLLPSAVSKKLIPGKQAKDIVEAGRKVGLSEAQITPLIQGEKKVATLSKIARKGTKTKERFAEIKEKLGDSYNSIKSRPEAQVKLPNAEQIQLRNQFNTIRNELSKTLAPSPDREAALNFIEKSLESLRDTQITPEYLVNFWQDINKAVKWNSINGGKKALARLKEPVSKALEKVSPSLAQDFEMTNELYSKYAQISKKLKPDLVDSFVNKAELLAAPAAGIALIQGNPWVLASVGGESALRLLGREMLINPYFQNIAKKLVVNFNQSSAKGVNELVKQVQEYMERKHPNEDWSFLTRED